ncbi:MAG: glycosyltransferase family 9 protein [Planctomycetota bacterium]
MQTLLILKTGALGDVLRTTSILPGLHARYPGLEVTWWTAPGAVDLLAGHAGIARVETVKPDDPADVERALAELDERSFDRVLSLDDEESMCRLASAARAEIVSGAYLADDGRRVYSPDVAEWFDMGLLSVHGKERADALKVANTRSHAAIYASMLGIEMGEPRLALPESSRSFAEDRWRELALDGAGTVIGLNTGSGGRWASKRLSVERTVELAERVYAALGGNVAFLLLGGPEEAERNARIERALAGRVRLADAGTDNALLDFAALVDRLDLLVTSDSLALHVAVARRVPVVAFFAPTSAAEIELYGRGRKVVSTAPDYCSYAKDADTSSLTPERIAAAVDRCLSTRTPLRR